MRCTFVSPSDKNWEDLAGWRSGGGGGGGVKMRDLADVSQHGSFQLLYRMVREEESQNA